MFLLLVLFDKQNLQLSLVFFLSYSFRDTYSLGLRFKLCFSSSSSGRVIGLAHKSATLFTKGFPDKWHIDGQLFNNKRLIIPFLVVHP